MNEYPISWNDLDFNNCGSCGRALVRYYADDDEDDNIAVGKVNGKLTCLRCIKKDNNKRSLKDAFWDGMTSLGL